MNVCYTTALSADQLTVFVVFEETAAAVIGALPAEIRASVEKTIKFDAENLADGKAQRFVFEKYAFLFLSGGKLSAYTPEKFRALVNKAVATANSWKSPQLTIVALGLSQVANAVYWGRALGEIPYLGSYQFYKYKTNPKDKNTLESVSVWTDLPNAEAEIKTGARLGEATNIARDLVNEPPNVLTAVTLAKAAVDLGKKYGFAVEVFEKSKIESLKMGGLLAVNRGSLTPPTFSILEHKPANARNEKPIILVGKGITFDTGGLSLKPTPGSMDSMKSDMGGAAAVIGAMVALAAENAPYHVIGFIPSTDNRPGQEAYTPNDIITMYDGSTVEVLNTDAEGRMILADALAFAKQYQPQLVIDLATLTGAAVIAVGAQAATMMTTAPEEANAAMKKAGFNVHERVVELPLWDEYAEQLKTAVADQKNIGGRDAGSITAGKFLQKFTDYPWIHLDIAGPAFLEASSDYRPKHGTGYGVRLLFDFITQSNS